MSSTDITSEELFVKLYLAMSEAFPGKDTDSHEFFVQVFSSQISL
jgi:hypothetical protein